MDKPYSRARTVLIRAQAGSILRCEFHHGSRKNGGMGVGATGPAHLVTREPEGLAQRGWGWCRQWGGTEEGAAGGGVVTWSLFGHWSIRLQYPQRESWRSRVPPEGGMELRIAAGPRCPSWENVSSLVPLLECELHGSRHT